MASPLILLLTVFSYLIDEHSCLKCCIFTKLSQIVCLITVQILVCQHAKYDGRLWKVNCCIWVCLMGIFKYYFMFETLYLHQSFTNCVLKQKSKDEKLFFVIICGYVSLVFNLFFEILMLLASRHLELLNLFKIHLFFVLAETPDLYCFIFMA